MRNSVRFMYVLCVLVMCPHMATMRKCWAGTYVYKSGMCTECPDGTVMPHREHENTACLPCEKIRDPVLETLVSPCNKTHQAVIHCVEGYYRDPDYHGDHDHKQASCRPCDKIKDPDLEILISPCNKTHDAVIHCVDGYYRDEARNPRETGQCKKCSECPQFTGRPCGTYKDAVCCLNENDDVVLNHDGVPECIERPWFCRRGQYFDTKAYYCLPCPENTFMNLDYHIQPSCLKCGELKPYRPLHSVIIQPCNRTHAPVIRCEDGFFIKPNMGYRDDATGCSPCTDCSTKTDVQYEGRKCDGMEDTVCCPQANMAVIDTPNGPVCCPEANMAVAETSEGPECVPPSLSFSDVPLTDWATTTDPKIKKIVSADVDTKSLTQFVSGLLFAGILVGIVLTLLYCLIYRRFFRRRWHRWLNARKRSSRSESDAQSEDGGAGEDDSLQEIPRDSGSQNRLRHRVAGLIYEGTERLRNRLSGFGMQHAINDEYGRVQCCGDESDLHSKKESCANKANHAKCISVQVFDIQHLSEGFRDGGKMAYIKAVCDLTVRLKVNHTSSRRPKNYPCRNLGGNVGGGIKRFGTGMVFQVRKKFAEVSNTTCPCRYCSVYPSEAKMNWAEFAVATSAQIVYDTDECKRTSCRLQFDSDEDFVHASSLKGRAVKPFNKSQDFRVLCCVTHDQKVSQRLEGMVAHFNELLQECKLVPEVNIDDEKLAVLISQQHGLSKKVQTGKATMMMDDVTQKWSYDTQTCPGSCGAPVCILGKGQGSSILTTIHSMDKESTGFYIKSAHDLHY